MIALACASPSARIHQAFLGMNARSLQLCLGPGDPLDTPADPPADVEHLRYRWAWSNPAVGVEITGLDHSPRLMAGSHHATDLPLGGYCQLDFTLRDGRVDHLDVTGRTDQNLNADADCLKRVRWCVEDD